MHPLLQARATHLAGALVLTPGLLLAASPPRAQEPTTADYLALDDVAGSHVRLATFPVRPMVIDPAGRLWVVNHHDSTVERFDLVASSSSEVTPAAVYDVPWDPVAIAFWPGTQEGEEQMLVVCSGTWAVVALDYATGEVERLIQLRPTSGILEDDPAALGRMSEPADILVDADTDMAFVTAGGADAVLQIDLVAGEVVQIFDELRFGTSARMKRPVFLSFAPASSGDPPPPRQVLVAPMLSGNNTLWNTAPVVQVNGNEVKKLVGTGLPLPDEDLFRITPWESGTSAGSIEPIATGVGTVLFAHGVAPDGKFWQLCTDARNAIPDAQNEPDVKGKFTQNGVTIFAFPSATPYAATAGDFHSLDSSHVPGGSGSAGESVGQPYALDFSPSGKAFVTGLLTDNVAVLAASGARLLEWDVPSTPTSPGAPSRAIPRGILVVDEDGDEGTVLVYGWGDNRVRQFDFDLGSSPGATPGPVYALRHDPTPPEVAEGRAFFFDGSRSAAGNQACASCHAECGSDFLVWNLSHKPLDDDAQGNVVLDDKGGMFTQTLVGLERLGPFHWRGERLLEDFRPAFAGLLDATPPSDEEFRAFETFLFSLTNPANRFQNRDRVVDEAIQAYTLYSVPPEDVSAVDGQTSFFDDISLRGEFACGACHAFPMGTINDVNIEIMRMNRPRLAHRKPAPFHELWRKQQSTVQVKRDIAGNVEPRAFLGSGLTHPGTFVDLRHFHCVITEGNCNPPASSLAEDIASFVQQWDQGLAPAVHFAYLLDANSLDTQGEPTADAQAELDFMMQQAEQKEHCDLAAFGTAVEGAGFTPMRWAFDADLDVFVAEDSQRSSRVLDDFIEGAEAGERHLFLGLPKGMARRWAIDYDMDGILNAEDSAPHDPDTDSGDVTSPSFVAGPIVAWETAKVARIVFRSDEPTRYIVQYWPNSQGIPANSQRVESDVFSMTHAPLLTNLRPSTADTLTNWPNEGFSPVETKYVAVVTIFDRKGNRVSSAPLEVTTAPFIEPDHQVFDPDHKCVDRVILQQHLIEAIEMSTPDLQQDPVPVTVTVDVALQRGGQYVGNDGTFASLPADERVVVGRVFRRRDFSGEQRYMPLTVTAGSNSLVAGDVYLVSTGGQKLRHGADTRVAKWLVGTEPTGTGVTPGRTTLEFDLSPSELATGDHVVFVVDAVVEISSAVQTSGSGAILPTTRPGTGWTENDGQAAFTQWVFPDTKEARSLVEALVN